MSNGICETMTQIIDCLTRGFNVLGSFGETRPLDTTCIVMIIPKRFSHVFRLTPYDYLIFSKQTRLQCKSRQGDATKFMNTNCPCNTCCKPDDIKSNRPLWKDPCPLQILPCRKMQHLFGLGLFLLTQQGRLLGVNSLDLSLTGSLGLCALGIHLLLKNPLSGLLSLCTVNVFN